MTKKPEFVNVGRHQIQRVGIVGCELSGCGIARVVALAGYQVHLCENSQEDLDRAFEETSIFFKRQSIRGTLRETDMYEALLRVQGSVDLDDLEGSDLIIDAIPDHPERKKKLIRELDHRCVQPTILAIHTSSLSLEPLARVAQHPEKIAGLHFFQPIHIVRLVEVVKTSLLNSSVIDILYDFVKSLKREPVTVTDSPGFVVNRLVIAYLLNAIRLLEAGIATQEDIDKAMHIGCGYPVGPFKLMDFLGLDWVRKLADSFYQKYHDPQYEVPPLLDRLVEAGRLGEKTGEGFYAY